MAYADPADVEAALGRALTSTEEERVDFLLIRASAIIDGFCGQSFDSSSCPDAVMTTCAMMVARLFDRGAGAQVASMAAGPFSVGFGQASSSGDMWLTSADKQALAPWRVGLGVVDFSTERFV